MRSKGKLVLYHAPNTRSSATLPLLDELGADYELRHLDMKAGEQRGPAYLAINPMGKVPALVHDGAIITEQVAIYLYLADLFPEAGLAPPIGDPLRGPYLRWLVFYGSSFEPAFIDRALKREPGPAMSVPYGDFDTMLATALGALEPGPYLLGDRFSAADLLWGSSLALMRGWNLVPDLPVIRAYVERHEARPSVIKAKAADAARVTAG
jgi:glutathione S-transferase